MPIRNRGVALRLEVSALLLPNLLLRAVRAFNFRFGRTSLSRKRGRCYRIMVARVIDVHCALFSGISLASPRIRRWWFWRMAGRRAHACSFASNFCSTEASTARCTGFSAKSLGPSPAGPPELTATTPRVGGEAGFLASGAVWERRKPSRGLILGVAGRRGQVPPRSYGPT